MRYSLASLSPFTDFERLWDAFDRMSPTRDTSPSGLSIPMDIYEQNGRLNIRASVPGVRPEDLKLTVDEGILTLSGEFKNEYEQKDGGRVFHREHAFGRFTRSVRLPDDIDENKVEANFENGVVTISIPRAQKQEPQPKQIPIRQGAGQAGGRQAITQNAEQPGGSSNGESNKNKQKSTEATVR